MLPRRRYVNDPKSRRRPLGGQGPSEKDEVGEHGLHVDVRLIAVQPDSLTRIQRAIRDNRTVPPHMSKLRKNKKIRERPMILMWKKYIFSIKRGQAAHGTNVCTPPRHDCTLLLPFSRCTSRAVLLQTNCPTLAHPAHQQHAKRAKP